LSPVTPTIFAALGLVIFQHFKSGEAVDASWLFAYTLFCSPPIVLWLAGRIFRLRMAEYVFALVGATYILIIIALTISKEVHMVLPATAITFLYIAGISFLLAVMYRFIAFAKNYVGQHLTRR
jgi:hypothetical protein